MSDIFDFEELTAEILGITDEQREDDDFLGNAFFDKFEIDFDLAYGLALELLKHTPKIEAGLSGETYNAFVSRKGPFMLMKQKADK